MAKTIKVKAEVKVPVVPNFFIHPGGKIAVGSITDEGLKEIAKAWLENLLLNAKRQRKVERKKQGSPERLTNDQRKSQRD